MGDGQSHVPSRWAVACPRNMMPALAAAYEDRKDRGMVARPTAPPDLSIIVRLISLADN